MHPELVKILKEMDLPLERKDADIPTNCRWLLSNMGFLNSKHPNYKKAKTMLKEMNKKQETTHT
jgi:hypothetical protein